MKNHKTFLYAMLSIGLLGMCSCGSKVKWPALPIEEATPYFADAAKVQTVDTAYYEVKDAKGNKLGTILFSSPYSDGVKGFNGPTPLLIALDADGRIKNIVLLENQETPNFAKRVVEGGLYEAWNGLTVCHLHLEWREKEPCRQTQSLPKAVEEVSCNWYGFCIS